MKFWGFLKGFLAFISIYKVHTLNDIICTGGSSGDGSTLGRYLSHYKAKQLPSTTDERGEKNNITLVLNRYPIPK